MRTEDSERWRRLEELLEAALKLPPEERAAFLDEACGDDAELRAKAEAMLGHEASVAGFMEEGALEAVAQAVAKERQTWRQGERIGHYRIERQLGVGGMGAVYLAQDESLGRWVAIKLLLPELADDAERLRRFEQEARAASALNHPNILTVHEIGQHEAQRFIVTEFIKGRTLRQMLQEARSEWRTALDYAIQIAGALAAAHAHGIIHRDIKPENIMVRDDGGVKVLDFGIAKLNGEQAFRVPPSGGSGSLTSPEGRLKPPLPPEGGTLNTVLTGVGLVLGTVSYMSPEQARGDELDARSDLFSLGVVLFELVTGRRLFEGRSYEEVRQALLDPREAPQLAVKLGDAPPEFSQVIRKAVCKDSAKRYASADEMLVDLKLVRRRLETRFSRRVMMVGAAALIVAVLATAGASYFSIETKWDERVMHDGHARRVRQLALAPDGETLVSVGNDNKVIVWDWKRRQRRATLNEHTRSVNAIAFSPDGQWFATASSDGRVIIWDAERLAKVAVLPGPPDVIDVIAFTPDGRFFITPGGPDTPKTQNLWEVGTWRRVRQLPDGKAALLSLDSRLLADGDWSVIDLHSGKEITNRAESLWSYGALSPDGAQLATVDNGGLVSFWDVSRFWSAGERRLLNRFPAHRDHGRTLAYSPDGRMVASGSENIILWDARTHEKLARFTYKDMVNSLTFSRDSRQIISGHGDGAVIIWDIAEKAPLANLAEHCGPVLAASFSPDGQSVVSASEDHSVIIWDAASGLKRSVLIGHNAPVTSAVFSIDGQWLLSNDLYSNAILWDAATGAQLRAFAPARKRDTDFSYCAALSPDKRWVATSFGVYATDDGHLAVEFFRSGDELTAEIHGAAFSSDGRWLACVGTGGYVALWEVAQWRQHKALKAGGNFNTVAFSRDGQGLAIGNNEGGIGLWQAEPLGEVGSAGRHPSGIEAVAFSPDGSVLVSASDDQTVALWDVAQRRFIGNVGRHTLPVLAVAFAPDGRLVTGGHDQTVRVYKRQRALWGWTLD